MTVSNADYFEIDWGDGQANTYYPGDSPEHVYYDDGKISAPHDDYAVQVTAYSSCGLSTSATATVTVNNVDPTANDDDVETDEDYSIDISVLDNDTDSGTTN